MNKRLKRGEPGKSCIKQYELSPMSSFIGFPVEEGDYVTVSLDETDEKVIVRLLRERTQ